MTDALEELLDEDEEEQEQEADLPVKGRAVMGRALPTAPLPGENAGAGWEDFAGETPGKQSAPQREGAPLRVEGTPEMEEGQTGSGPLARSLSVPLKRAGRAQATEDSKKLGPEAALYESMTRTRRAAGYRRERGGGWLPLERQKGAVNGATPWEAAALDRVFQRDARRYDGGFTWL